jgi:hypothetical protein
MRYKGRPSKRNVAAAHPHHVVLKVPAFGLGVRTDAINPKVREIAGEHQASWSDLVGEDSYSVHGFKDPAHAETFRAWIAERWPELLDLTPTPVPAPRPRTVRSH